jgi:hypothetical protein
MKALAVSLIVVGTVITAFAADGVPSPRDDASDAEVQVGRQVKIQTFAFGGVGSAGITLDGERYFFAVLTSAGAKGFIELFERGDAQAKAYALAGLRWFSDGRYDRLRDVFVAEGRTVRMAQGCLFGDFEAATIAARIDAREWDDYITAVVKKRRANKAKPRGAAADSIRSPR